MAFLLIAFMCVPSAHQPVENFSQADITHAVESKA